MSEADRPRWKRRAEALVPLRETRGVQLSGESPDVRGWEVLSADRKFAGRVAEMLVDLDAMEVGYLEVELEAPPAAPRPGCSVQVPVRRTVLDRAHRRVYLDGLTAADLRALARPFGGRGR